MTTENREVFAKAYRLYENYEQIPDGMSDQECKNFYWHVAESFRLAYAEVKHTTVCVPLFGLLMETIYKQFRVKYPGQYDAIVRESMAYLNEQEKNESSSELPCGAPAR